MRKIYLDREVYNPQEAIRYGLYDLDNKIEQFKDDFYDGTTEEERKAGITYHWDGFEVKIIEE